MMKKRGLVSSHNLSTFPSPPGLPGDWENLAMNEKGWSSERVPPASGSSRRTLSVAGVTPFLSGRPLPSKWEDAERWIGSPVVGNVAGKSLPSLPRRQKSKSGPIVEPPAVVTYNPSYSPAVAGNFMAHSVLSTGGVNADAVSFCCGGGDDGHGGQSHIPLQAGEQFACQPRWSDILRESSSPSSPEDKQVMEALSVSQGDKGTRISHGQNEGTDCSPKGKSSSSSSSSSPTLLSVMKKQGLEVRDVRVDKGTTVIWWSKRHKVVKSTQTASPDLVTSNLNSMDPGAASLDTAEADINVSKLQKEDARIMAWENLQKAKAEAAMHRLEVKLERKRASSIDDILNKLRNAQMKATRMRSSLSANQTDQVPKAGYQLLSFRNHVKSSSLRRYFTCYGS